MIHGIATMRVGAQIYAHTHTVVESQGKRHEATWCIFVPRVRVKVKAYAIELWSVFVDEVGAGVIEYCET